MADDLDTAVREAKVAAGLDPDEKHQAILFHEHIDPKWRQPFWERLVDEFVTDQQCTSAYLLQTQHWGDRIVRCERPLGHKRPPHRYTDDVGYRTRWESGDANERMMDDD